MNIASLTPASSLLSRKSQRSLPYSKWYQRIIVISVEQCFPTWGHDPQGGHIMLSSESGVTFYMLQPLLNNLFLACQSQILKLVQYVFSLWGERSLYFLRRGGFIPLKIPFYANMVGGSQATKGGYDSKKVENHCCRVQYGFLPAQGRRNTKLYSIFTLPMQNGTVPVQGS